MIDAASIVAHELALFAAIGFLIGGIDDLLVDLIWIVRLLWRRATVYRVHQRSCIDTLAAPERPGRLAVFIPAWDESTVIGAMLAHTLKTFDHKDYRVFVGCYPNDPATIAAIEAVRDDRISHVVAPHPGPTTKADCLNAIWRTMLADERTTGVPYKAIVLHDAEDVVHSGELRVFDRLIEKFDIVQLPVMPLVNPRSRWVGGHYCDEFAEHHGKLLVVRDAIGAALPLAGVGCAISREAIQAIADGQEGDPFDSSSLTEDYEVGLKVAEAGRPTAFVAIPAPGDVRLVAVRAFFPARIDAAVRQKARWMAGIALAGWDRLGWRRGLAENWMRGRDRRALLSALVLAAAYAALALWVGLLVIWWTTGYVYRQPAPLLTILLWFNLGLLTWRLAFRFAFVRAIYGWREGLRAIPRAVVANIIAMMAARRALGLYWSSWRRREAMTWDKTDHHFPEIAPAE